MRILYLCADRGITLSKHNGATAHFRSLVGSFARIGHDVLVMTPTTDDTSVLGVPVERIPTPDTLADLLADVDAEVPRPERERQRHRRRVVHALGHSWNNVMVERTLDDVVPRFRPDFIFELYSPFGVAAGLWARRHGMRHLLNVHAPLAWEGATFRKQALQEAAEVLEDATFTAARRICTNSEEMKDQLVTAGVEASKISVVINGVDAESFSPDGAATRPVPSDAVVIGFCGSLKGWHGVDVLVAAFRKLATDPRYHLLIVGDGPLRKDVQALAEELPGRVTFTGAMPFPEVPDHVRAMDIAVAPFPPLERFYFSPLKVLEYMACGKPTVASSIGQVNHLVREGETGLLVPPGDADALARALSRLGEDPEARRRMGREACDEARERHAWTARAAEIVDAAMA